MIKKKAKNIWQKRKVCYKTDCPYNNSKGNCEGMIQDFMFCKSKIKKTK